MVQDACFVRFLGHLTGRAGLAQLAGTFVSDPRRHFAINQSVRAQIVQVPPALHFCTSVAPHAYLHVTLLLCERTACCKLVRGTVSLCCETVSINEG